MSYQVSQTCQIPTLGSLYEKFFGEKTDGFFVDVGAGDGIQWSNTSGLARAEWGGIMIEPHPDSCRYAKYLNINHPRVAIVNQCAGSHDGTMVKLYLGGARTTRADMIPIYNYVLSVGLDQNHYIVCNSDTLNTILEKNKAPLGFDVLSIDVEGAELDVLEGFDIEKWRPKFCIIETHTHHQNQMMNVASDEIHELFEFHDYARIYCDAINSIYVSRELWSESDYSTEA